MDSDALDALIPAYEREAEIKAEALYRFLYAQGLLPAAPTHDPSPTVH